MQVSTAVHSGPDVLGWIRAVLSIAFVIAIPLFLIGTDVRWLFTDRALILQGFRQNDVAATTRLDDAQLSRIAGDLVDYFQAPRGPLLIQVNVDGQQRSLFNQREIQHMEDVQALVQAFFALQIAAGAVILVRLVSAVVLDRSFAYVGRDMLFGALLVVALVLVVGVLAFINFDALWTTFHEIAFRNDFWQLDPRTDYLIMLFPEPFWYTSTFRLASALVAETAGVAIVGLILWRLGMR